MVVGTLPHRTQVSLLVSQTEKNESLLTYILHSVFLLFPSRVKARTSLHGGHRTALERLSSASCSESWEGRGWPRVRFANSDQAEPELF